KEAFDNYIAELTKGVWAFRARKPLSGNYPATIMDWDNEEGGTGRLRFDLAVANDVGAVGEVCQIQRVAMLNPLFARPNGQDRIAAKEVNGNVATYTLRSTEGMDATQIDEPGEASPVSYALFDYSEIEATRQTTRKKGVGSLRPRGRSRGRSRRLV